MGKYNDEAGPSSVIDTNNHLSEYEQFKLHNYLQRNKKHIEPEPENDDLMDSNNVLFQTLLNDPVKRAQVLQILTQEGFVPQQNKVKRGNNRKKNNEKATDSPIDRLFGKVKGDLAQNVKKKPKYDSPSARFRQKCLEQMEAVSIF